MSFIIFGINLHGGGAERQIINLLNNWPDISSKPSVVLMENWGVFLKSIPKDIRVFTLSKRMPSDTFLKIFWSIKVLAKFIRFLFKHKPRVILTFLWLPSWLVILSRTFFHTKPKLVFSVQGGDLKSHFANSFLGRFCGFIFNKFVLKETDHFICISTSFRENLIRMGVSGSRISLIYNSVDHDEINKEITGSTGVLPRKFPIRVVAAGRLVEQKGFDILLDAFYLLKELPAELVILGEGPLRECILEQIRSLNFQTKVFLPGFSKSIYEWFKDSDIFVSSSRWEPFGIVMLEAMALGLPIVATVTDGARDLVENGINGFTVDSWDPEPLAEAIRKLIQNPELRAKMGREGIIKSRQYEAREITQKYHNLVNYVVLQNPSV
jgi:glycosyltransferase involved in cell wall biosynthesis